MKFSRNIYKFANREKHYSIRLFIEAYSFEKYWKVIHIKPWDKIFEYEKYFQRSYWRLSDWHLSGSKNVKYLWKNYEGKLRTFLWSKSIQINMQNDDFKQIGSLIQVVKWNQLIIEFDGINIDFCSNRLYNKYQSTIFSNPQKTWIFIDPDWIQNICNLNRHLCSFRFKNAKYFVTDSFIIDHKSSLIENLYKTIKHPIKCEINGIIQSDFNSQIYSQNLKTIRDHQIENLMIDSKHELKEEELIDILNPIFLAKRLNRFHLKTNNLKMLNNYHIKPFHKNSKLKVKIETKIKLDIASTINLKNIFSNITFINP